MTEGNVVVLVPEGFKVGFYKPEAKILAPEGATKEDIKRAKVYYFRPIIKILTPKGRKVKVKISEYFPEYRKFRKTIEELDDHERVLLLAIAREISENGTCTTNTAYERYAEICVEEGVKPLSRNGDWYACLKNLEAKGLVRLTRSKTNEPYIIEMSVGAERYVERRLKDGKITRTSKTEDFPDSPSKVRNWTDFAIFANSLHDMSMFDECIPKTGFADSKKRVEFIKLGYENVLKAKRKSRTVAAKLGVDKDKVAKGLAMIANYALAALMDGEKPTTFAMAVLKWLRMKGVPLEVVDEFVST